MSSLLYLFPSLSHALCSELSSSWCGSDAGTEVYHSLCHMMLFSCLQPLITVNWRLIALITFQRTLCSPSWNNICSDRSFVSLFSHTDHMAGRIWFCFVSSWKFMYMCNTCGLSYFQSMHWSTSTGCILSAACQSFPGKCWGNSVNLKWHSNKRKTKARGTFTPFRQNLNSWLFKILSHTLNDLTSLNLIKSGKREILCCKIQWEVLISIVILRIISESDLFYQPSIISVQGLVDLRHIYIFQQMLHFTYSWFIHDCSLLSLQIYLLKRVWWNKLHTITCLQNTEHMRSNR